MFSAHHGAQTAQTSQDLKYVADYLVKNPDLRTSFNEGLERIASRTASDLMVHFNGILKNVKDEDFPAMQAVTDRILTDMAARGFYTALGIGLLPVGQVATVTNISDAQMTAERAKLARQEADLEKRQADINAKEAAYIVKVTELQAELDKKKAALNEKVAALETPALVVPQAAVQAPEAPAVQAASVPEVKAAVIPPRVHVIDPVKT